MFSSLPHTPNDLTFQVAILLTSFLLVLSDAVPSRGSEWGTVLSQENLVPDGFIIILWLLLWDLNVVVSSFLPHRSATADTMAPIFACRLLIYSCID